MEDRQLMRLIWHWAERSLEILAKKFGPRLYRTARNILDRHEDAEESVNDTYLAVWNAIPPKEPDSLAGFVYKTGRNIALNHLRAGDAQKRCSRYDISLQELEGCIAGPDLLEQVTARELGRAIDAFLDTVSPQSRILFLRRYWFGDSVKGIAKAFLMTESAVSVRLSRTREALKAYLIKEGFYE